MQVLFHYAAVDAENEGATVDSKPVKETIDLKEVKRVDLILASLQRKVTLFSENESSHTLFKGDASTLKKKRKEKNIGILQI